MKLKVFLFALCGSVFVSAALFYPCRLFVPDLITSNMPQGNNTVALICIGVAVLFMFITSFLAGRFAGNGTLPGGVAAGIVAGVFTSLAAYSLLIAPTAGIWGSQSIFSHGLVPEPDLIKYNEVLIESTVSILWYTRISFIGALGAGIGVGALGGLCSGSRFENKDTLWNLISLPVGLIGAFSTSLTLWVVSSVAPLLVTVTSNALEKINYLPLHSVTSGYYLHVLPIYGLLLFWFIVNCLSVKRAVIPLGKMSLLYAIPNIAIPALLAYLLYLVDRTHFIILHLPLGIVLLCLGGFTAYRILKKEKSLPIKDSLQSKILFQFGLVTGMVLLLNSLFNGYNTALNLVLIPVVAISPLIGMQSTEAPPITISSMIRENFRYHAASLPIFLLSIFLYVTIILISYRNLENYLRNYGKEIIIQLKKRKR